MMSKVEISLARIIGSLSTTSAIPVANLIFLVEAAIAPKVMKGSKVCEYSLGKSPPPGNGVSLLTGICVCSGRKIDSNPLASASCARMIGLIA